MTFGAKTIAVGRSLGWPLPLRAIVGPLDGGSQSFRAKCMSSGREPIDHQSARRTFEAAPRATGWADRQGAKCDELGALNVATPPQKWRPTNGQPPTGGHCDCVCFRGRVSAGAGNRLLLIRFRSRGEPIARRRSTLLGRSLHFKMGGGAAGGERLEIITRNR